MELIRSINSNQIEKLKESGLNVTNFEFTLQTEALLNYFIDMEINEKKLHIIIGCNWDSQNGDLLVYDDKDIPITTYKFENINSVDDLNKTVIDYVLNNLIKII